MGALALKLTELWPFLCLGASKHEYRRQCPKSHCDVIAHIINIEMVFSWVISGDLSISDVKMNISEIFLNFQNDPHFEVRCVFKPEVVPEVESNTRIGHVSPYILRFCSKL